MDLTREAIESLYDKGSSLAPPVIERPDGGKMVVVPPNYEGLPIEPLEKPLTRIRQAVTFYDLASFIAYVERYKSNATRVFGLPGHLKLGASNVLAVLDYHEKAGTSEIVGKPNHGAHTAQYLPQYAEEWLRWTKAQPMGQAEFAEFIEENRKDIKKPDAAMLLDIVSKFRATKKQDYDSVVHQPDGTVQIAWSDRTENAGKPGVAVPTELELGIPVFFAGTLYAVPVFLRYRIKDGVLVFTVKVDRGDYIEQAAFKEITDQVTKETGIEVYVGKLA